MSDTGQCVSRLLHRSLIRPHRLRHHLRTAVVLIALTVSSWASAYGKDIVLLGDSLTGSSGRYGAHLGIRVRHAGVRGATTTQMRERLPLVLKRARVVVVWGGVNDIAYRRPTQEIIDNLAAIYSEAKSRRARVVALTIAPFCGDPSWPQSCGADETDKRRAINHWIRSQADVDAVVDAEAVLRSPDDETRLASSYDLGDHIHTNAAGDAAVARAVAVELKRLK